MRKVLIVDDEQEICLLLSILLKKLGIKSTIAHSLTQGLANYEPGEHELVFLDINLPDGNGLDIIPVLKSRDDEIKIVVISAYDIKIESDEAEGLGIYRFIGKPFTKKTIVQLVDKIDSEN